VVVIILSDPQIKYNKLYELILFFTLVCGQLVQTLKKTVYRLIDGFDLFLFSFFHIHTGFGAHPPSCAIDTEVKVSRT
jgi:hypothetical protein